MSTLKTFLAFVIGVAGGSALTYFLVKKKYESIAEEEINAVREAYHNAAKGSDDETDEPSLKEEPSKNNYERSSLDADRHAKAQENITKPIPKDYTHFFIPEQDVIINEPEDTQKEMEYKAPYVISPDQFGEIPSYTEMHLILHPNGAITDSESGEELDDVDDFIGTDWSKRIGEYEMNVVRVRNERLSMDLEIEQILPTSVLAENPTVVRVTNDGSGTHPSRKPHEVD